MTTLSELKELLELKFPNAYFRKGVDFSLDTKDSIWCGCDSIIGKNTKMFNHNGKQSMYEFGAHKKLCKFVNKYGYFVEAYDCETYFIYKI